MVEFLFLFSSHGRKKERKKLSLNGLSCIKGITLFFPHGRVWKSFELEGSGVEWSGEGVAKEIGSWFLW